MTRPRSSCGWTVALWVVCLLAAAGALAGDRQAAPFAGPIAAGVAAKPATTDPAVLPARIADEVLVAAQSAPSRLLFLAAIISLVAGLPAALRRRATAIIGDPRRLLPRRGTVGLRAPPLLFG